MLWWTLRQLRSSDPGTRLRAAQKLGEIKDARAVELLIARLKDGKSDVRNAAANALGNIGDKRAVAPLLAALDDEWMSREAIAALVKIGDVAMEPLMAALKGSNKNVRGHAAALLVKMGAAAVGPLVAVLNIGETDIRKRAVEDDITERVVLESLVKIGQASVESLIEVLKCKDRIRQQAKAAEALGEIRDVRAVEPLISVLDSDFMVQEAAIKALNQIGDARAVEPLISVLDSQYSAVKKAAMDALGRIGDARAVKPLKKYLKDKYVGENAEWALSSLGWEPENETQQAMLASARRDWEELERLGGAAFDVLLDKIWSDKRAAALLGKIGDARAVDQLIESLGHHHGGSWGFQVTAAEALGKIGDARAIKPLLIALKEGYPEVSKAAAEALGNIGDASTVMSLVEGARSNSRYTGRYVAAILQILNHNISMVEAEHLRTLANIHNLVEIQYKCNEGCEVVYESGRQEVDCAQVRQLARQELIRRGLEA